MKKAKIFLFILIFLLVIIIIFSSCKKTNALQSGTYDLTFTISERDQQDYNFVAIINLAKNTTATTSDFMLFDGYFLNITNNNVLTLRNRSGGAVIETHNITSRLLQIEIVYDVDSLYLIIHQLFYTIRHEPGVVPSVDGIERSMITRYNVVNAFNSWSNSYLSIKFSFATNWKTNYLVNWSYIDYSENDPTIINEWVDNQLTNYETINSVSELIYDAGADDGYNTGYGEGYQAGDDDGYNTGYGEGYQAGDTIGYNRGVSEGYELGERDGYRDGYDDGQAGENAISPTFNVLTAIFTSIGSILAIELVPHIPIGLFFLVPLFFAVLGLILWIWRRN